MDFLGDDLNFDLLGGEDDESVFLRTKEKTYFDVYGGRDILRRRAKLLEDGESLRAISYAGGFSSCSVVLWIADRTKIRSMFASTLRVGKKEIDALADLHSAGRLDKAHFILSGLAKNNTAASGKDYRYTEYFEQVCMESGFSWKYAKNHSKVILLDADSGKYVVETSSNLNENPKIEQFCITCSEEVYEFYKAGLFG